MDTRFREGEVIVRREMLDGREWLVYPVRVAGDDEHALAVYLAQGTPLTFGRGDFRWGPHTWLEFAHVWQSSGVLQLQRPGEGYAVWGRWESGELREWYVNFQARTPVRRAGSTRSTTNWTSSSPATAPRTAGRTSSTSRNGCARAASRAGRPPPCGRPLPGSSISSSAANAGGSGGGSGPRPPGGTFPDPSP